MIYDKIKVLAAEKKVSINKIEKDLNLSTSSISKWNKSMPTAENLKKVADYLGVSMEDLLKEEKKTA